MPRFTNGQVADQFTKIADLLEIKGENRFKILAYRRAAENITDLARDINDIFAAGDLADISGVGKAIQDKIAELLTTGEMSFWERLRAEVPPSLIEVLAVPGLGPKTVKLLWEKLDVTNLDQLKAAAESGQLSGLPGLGKKTETNILKGIVALANRQSDRVRLDIAWPTAMIIVNALQTLPQVLRIEHAGSLRRFAPTIGDLDILVATHQPEPVMAAFKELQGITDVIGSGVTKTSIRFDNGLQADLRCLEPQHWGTALQYFTGSRAHNIKIRELAQKQGLSLNEYALTRDDGSQILCDTEAAVYETLGLPYIPPVLREDRGEVEAALAGKLPDLVSLADIKGDVHCHSTWSDGQADIETMARAALAKGYQYLVITDHSQSLGIANGLTPERLRQQRGEIKAAQAKVPNIRVLQGTEMEIKADGSLDFEDEVLAELDFVVASVHTGLQQNRESLTARMLNAIRNPYVRAIGHPTGRLLGKRESGDFDMETLLRVAAENGTMMEVNASAHRLDLDSIYVKRAIELGVTLTINCDAHHPDGFNELHFGVATAQRGWASAADIGNTFPLERLLSLKKERS